MADEDLFMDQERIQKMIAAGIYDEDMANRLKTIKNKDLKDSTTVRPAAERTPVRQMERQAPPFQPGSSRGRGRGFGRGQNFQRRGGRGGPRDARLSDEKDTYRKFGFQPLSSKWQVIDGPNEEKEEKESPYNKRLRGRSPQRDNVRDPFREGIRDGIQNKIQRNEIQMKLNADYSNDRNAGNSYDTDLRPKSDTDSRIRDTDLRAATNPFNSRKSASNLSNITFTANEDHFRHGGGDRGGIRGGIRGGLRGDRNTSFVEPHNHQKIGSSDLKNLLIDDLDDFIAKASNKLDIKPQELEAHNRGRGRGHSSQRNDNFNPHFGNERFYRSDDPLGLRQQNESFSQRTPEDDNINDSPDIIEVPEETDQNPIEILKETVEELAKSNLYCQYCDCYLSSLVDVNTHIGTAIHQQNMAKKINEENNNSVATGQSTPKDTVNINRPMSQTVVERVPTGMAVIAQMIERKQQITLKSLTEMDNYEISCDSEAALAKELAKLLTNELLNYKMNLMPDTVKEALKHQGIGLLNSMVTN